MLPVLMLLSLIGLRVIRFRFHLPISMNIEANRYQAQPQKGEYIMPRNVPAGTEFRVGKRLCVTNCNLRIVFDDYQDLTTAQLIGSEISAMGVGRGPNNAIGDLMANFAAQIDFLSSEDGKPLTAQEQERREKLLHLFTVKPNPQMEMSPEERDAWKEVM